MKLSAFGRFPNSFVLGNEGILLRSMYVKIFTQQCLSISKTRIFASHFCNITFYLLIADDFPRRIHARECIYIK